MKPQLPYHHTEPDVVVPFNEFFHWAKQAKKKFLKDNPALRFIVNALQHSEIVKWSPQLETLEKAVFAWTKKEEDNGDVDQLITPLLSYPVLFFVYLMSKDENSIHFPSYFVSNDLKDGLYAARPSGTGIALSFPTVAFNIDDASIDVYVESSSVTFMLACDMREPVLNDNGDQLVGILYGEDPELFDLDRGAERVFESAEYLKETYPEELMSLEVKVGPAFHKTIEKLGQKVIKWYKSEHGIKVIPHLVGPSIALAKHMTDRNAPTISKNMFTFTKDCVRYDPETRLITALPFYQQLLGDHLAVKVSEYLGEIKGISDVSIKRDIMMSDDGVKLYFYYLCVAVIANPVL